MKRKDTNTSTRKKIEDYSYLMSNGIGKGYSSQVYKGKNDETGIETLISRLISSY